MTRRQWNFVEEFSDENDMKSFIKQNNVSIKRTETIALGKKVIYRCIRARKYSECDFQIRVIYDYNDEKIAVSTSSEHNHDNRASTTCAASPIRDIVKKSVAVGLTQSQTRRAVQNEYTSDVPSLLNYHRSVSIPNVRSTDDFRV
ncbi:unnamed protein product [Didymodactylos carnosus]|uniref:Uncharacterized protein n=1 Tax=Didymodactylos carnosus TaxID=1234261 RepID=A0A8S2F3Y3_9BILA|nr:unnamed protein product [Didymodactylos carnosus]CAF4127344.1 unnamed protein product [Didymodactylos carnosus]